MYQKISVVHIGQMRVDTSGRIPARQYIKVRNRITVYSNKYMYTPTLHFFDTKEGSSSFRTFLEAYRLFVGFGYLHHLIMVWRFTVLIKLLILF